MKWNGSMYYNIISQDNMRVDRVALARVPCPEPPLLITRGLGTGRMGQGLTRPPCHLGPRALCISHPERARPGGRGQLERSDSPQRWKEPHVHCLTLPTGTDRDKALTSPESLRFSTHPRAHSELFTWEPHPYLPVTTPCGAWNTSRFPSTAPDELQKVLWVRPAHWQLV